MVYREYFVKLKDKSELHLKTKPLEAFSETCVRDEELDQDSVKKLNKKLDGFTIQSAIVRCYYDESGYIDLCVYGPMPENWTSAHFPEDEFFFRCKCKCLREEVHEDEGTEECNDN